MEELARIFFHVNARDADSLGPLADRDVQMAMMRERLIILGNLEVLWEIRIEVLLAVKLHHPGDLAVKRQGHPDPPLKRLLVEDRQRPGKPQTHRARLAIRRSTEFRGAPAEQLRFRAELEVNF